MRRSPRLGLAILAGLFALTIHVPPASSMTGTGTLFGTDGGGGNLYSIDPSSGAATLIGNMGFGAPSLAVDPTTGVLYAGQGGGSPILYVVDPATGAATAIGAVGDVWGIAGLDFDATGNLFAAVNTTGAGEGGDSLWGINKTTGAGSTIGSFGGSIGLPGGTEAIEAIAFDHHGNLWAASRSQPKAGGKPTLYGVNKATGAAAPIALILDATGLPPAGGVVSLQFGCGTGLYGGTGGGTGNLISITSPTGRGRVGARVRRRVPPRRSLRCRYVGPVLRVPAAACL
jgi:hypothetical protein